jgi:hypothetical protein
MATTFVLLATANIGTAPFTCLWETSPDADTWTPVEGETTVNLSLELEESAYVRVTMSNPAGSKESDPLYLEVPEPVVPTITQINPNFGLDLTFVTITGTDFITGGVDGVSFGAAGLLQDITVVNETTITGTVPFQSGPPTADVQLMSGELPVGDPLLDGWTWDGGGAA